MKKLLSTQSNEAGAPPLSKESLPAPKEEELKPWTVEKSNEPDGSRVFGWWMKMDDEVIWIERECDAVNICAAHNATLTRRASIPEQEMERIAAFAASAIDGHLTQRDPCAGSMIRSELASFVIKAINEALNWPATNSQDAQINAKD